jgi:membrane protein required for colicin V production
MGFLDIVIGGIILFGILRGLFRGLFLEIAGLVAVVLGIYGAIHFSYIISDYLVDRVDWQERYINLTAFSVTFSIIVLGIGLSGKLLTKVADMAALGFLNKLLGALFGGLKLAVILGAILVFFDKTNNTLEFVDKETTEGSILYEPVRDLGAMVFAYALKEKTSEPDEKNKNAPDSEPSASQIRSAF